MILMRHGESEFNVVYSKTRVDPGIRDPILTETGREQAAEAAQRLAGFRVRRILTSPYRRALETASIVADTLDLAITVDPAVGERAAFTCDLGTPGSALRTRWPHLGLDHIGETWWPEPVESEDALDARCRRFREAVAEAGDWNGVLVITHWGFIRGLTGHTVGNARLVAFDPAADHPGGGDIVPADIP